MGAGIIGCAIAYELSRRGVSCLLLDGRRLGMAATNAAAGVLSPLAEFQRPDVLVQLGLASLRLYPAWVERLREEAPDIDVEFVLNGVLRVAFDEEELVELRRGLRYRDELGVELIELDSASPGCPSTIVWAMSSPVIGARRMPLRKWPVATHTFSQPGSGPMMGSPSGEPGRRPAHEKCSRAWRSWGTSSKAARRTWASPRFVVRMRKPTSSTVAPAKTRPLARGMT